MGARHSGNETTVDIHVARDEIPARALLVICDDQVKTFELPERGVLLIGRAPEAEVRIDAPSISRRHAELSVEHDAVTLSDLGSRNGTRVRGAALGPDEKAAVVLGEPFEVGFAKCVLQRRLTFARLARLWTHEAFESRLEKACGAGGAFALMHIRVQAAADPSAVQVKLLDALSPKDILARSGAHEYEALVGGVEPERAEAIRTQILAKLDADADRVGVACAPRDGKTPLELQSKAWDALANHGASPSSVQLDESMRTLMQLVAKVAMSPLNALVMGETGAGKEVISERIHASSPRKDRPLVRLNCAALSETLLESELFGYERGAFTGAVSAKKGLLETAEGGTILLDEVGELPLGMQAKLLRVVEERRVLRVGGLESRPIDVRFLAATNRDLEKEAERGNFRQDLYFRLAGVTVNIPPLRERVSEIEPLARAFAVEAGAQNPVFSQEALELMRRYTWPGNIRELRNVVMRAVMLSDGHRIEPEHLPVEKMAARMARAPTPSSPPPTPGVFQATGGPSMAGAPMAAAPTQTATVPPDRPSTLRAGIEDYEKQRIVAALEQARGNQTQAAKLLGISRGTLVSRIEQFDLPRPRKGKGDD